MVQVIIEESRADRYLGCKRTSDRIWVRGDIRAGRTEEVRSKMMLNMMEDINRNHAYRRRQHLDLSLQPGTDRYGGVQPRVAQARQRKAMV